MGLKEEPGWRSACVARFELALVIGEAAHHGEHAAGAGLHHRDGALDLRDLVQAILPVLAGNGLHIDDVAGLQHLRDGRDGTAGIGSFTQRATLHAVEIDEAHVAGARDAAGAVLGRLEADARGVLAGVHHHASFQGMS